MGTIDLRDINFTTATLLDEACKTAKDKIFFEFPSRGVKETYGEFQAQTNRISNLLEEKGVTKGDKVAIMSENSPELLHVSYAVTNMGAIWVPVNSFLVGEGLRYIINVSDSAYAIVSSRYRERLEEAVGKVEKPIQIMSNEEVDEEAKGKSAEYKSTAKPDDVCYLLYTSGTTGFPKGVIHTHNSNIRYSIRLEAGRGLTSDDRTYVPLPFFHAWADLIMKGTIYFKAAMVVYERFHAETFWETVIKYKITKADWTGTMPLNLLKLPESDFEKKARIAVMGTIGGVYNEIKARWPHITFQSCYGLTEYPGITQVPLDDIVPGSDGVPLPYAKVFILDENEKPLPVGETGEIMVRCKCGIHMQGYYNNPEASARTLRGDDLYTGDLGYLDEHGHLHFAGRRKDALRVRGEMVSIDYTEHLINQHPKVAESAVTAYRSPEKEASKEDEIVVHIVVKKGDMLTPEEFHEWSEKNLAKFMRPRHVVFRDSLPKTATERIQHFILKEEGIKGATKLF